VNTELNTEFSLVINICQPYGAIKSSSSTISEEPGEKTFRVLHVYENSTRRRLWIKFIYLLL